MVLKNTPFAHMPDFSLWHAPETIHTPIPKLGLRGGLKSLPPIVL